MKLRIRWLRRCTNRFMDAVGLPWMAFPLLPEDGKVMFFSRDREDFGFLSNFYRCVVRIEGIEWHSTEAWYQGQKSENPEYRERLRQNESPSRAKFVGDSRVGDERLARKSWFRKRPEDLRADWEEVKVDVMRTALRAKFSQNENLRLALLRTWPAELIEDSTKDSFWGIGPDGAGRNMLGRLLMELRHELASTSANSLE